MSTPAETFSFSQVVPGNLMSDPQVAAACQALDSEFQSVTAAIPEIIILPNIAQQSDAILDALAVQFHVDYYDQTLPTYQKVSLIQNSINWHRIKGTPYAVVALINSIFGYAELQEWFQYGGSPYHFRVYTSNPNLDATTTANLTRAINSAKNCRSWLDGVVRIGGGITNTASAGCAIARHRTQTIWFPGH